jgi:anti-anti-sigma factor
MHVRWALTERRRREWFGQRQTTAPRTVWLYLSPIAELADVICAFNLSVLVAATLAGLDEYVSYEGIYSGLLVALSKWVNVNDAGPTTFGGMGPSINKRGLLMTTTNNPASDAPSHYGNPRLYFDGADIRAQCRHVATVVTVRGDINARNIERVSGYVRPLILPEKPFVLDLSGVNYSPTLALSLLVEVDEDCNDANIQWALIASHAVSQLLGTEDRQTMFPIADSVPHALQHFVLITGARRRLLLPLLVKTA